MDAIWIEARVSWGDTVLAVRLLRAGALVGVLGVEEVPPALSLGERMVVARQNGVMLEYTGVARPACAPTGAWAELARSAAKVLGAALLVALVAQLGARTLVPLEDAELASERNETRGELLKAAIEREASQVFTEDPSADGEQPGKRAQGDDGQMGAREAAPNHLRAGVAGPRTHASIELARDDAAHFGVIGLLAGGAFGDALAPSAAWGSDHAVGRDAMAARGGMFSDAIGDSAGFGGLGLAGAVEGSGGDGASIGLTHLDGDGFGFGSLGLHGSGERGSGSGEGTCAPGCQLHLLGGRNAKGIHTPGTPALMRSAVPEVVGGRLPADTIRRVIQQSSGRFRGCYAAPLATNPGLRGRVLVKFVIDRMGAVMVASDGGSDMPDKSVTQCVLRAMSNLSFPAPEGGVVSVVYPFLFSPE